MRTGRLCPLGLSLYRKISAATCVQPQAVTGRRTKSTIKRRQGLLSSFANAESPIQVTWSPSRDPGRMFFRLFGLVCAISCLYLLFLAKMHISRYVTALSLPSLGSASARCGSTASVDLSWHAPQSTIINNLTSVVNGTGIYGYIFDSSITPASVPYSTYNWCNMPHVRAQEYPPAPSGYKLEYVELVW